jgi:hypothetical protein
MTSHMYWQSPAIEQRCDQKEDWDGLVQFLTIVDVQKERRAGRQILNSIHSAS